MKIRLAVAGDVAALVELLLAMRDETRYAGLEVSPARLARNLGSQFARADATQCCFVAENAEGTLVGVLAGGLKQFLFEDFVTASEGLFYVHPGARGTTAAVKLIYAFREWAIARGVREIQFSVRSGKDIARTDRLMKRLGFNLIGGNYSLWVERGAQAGRA
jgi:GNAT superfamily N-acetyltransferase